MTTLYETLKLDLIDYRKQHDKPKSVLLQTLIGELNTKEKSNIVIDDAYVAKMIKSFVNNNTATLKDANDPVMIDRLMAENDLLNSYLPKLLSEEQVKIIIAENDLKDVPTGMKYFKEHFNGQYDGKMVSSLLKG